jgi:actin-related protein 6
MPSRRSKAPTIPSPSRTLVLDNGADTIKAGFVTHPTDGDDSPSKTDGPTVIPNVIARDRLRKVYVGSDLSKCRDFGEIVFRRPVDRGYIVNWEAQREIWEHEFFDDKAALKCDPSETRLVLAEQPNALPALQANCDQIVFEEFGFASYYRGIGPAFNTYNDVQATFRTAHDPASPPQTPAEILLLIDSGYSSTTITPVIQGRPLQAAIRRLDVGGKLLTNYLARLLSLRHFDMRNDTYIVNEMKEKACYVSLDFARDLETCWKGTKGERRPEYISGGGIARDYVLPDFHNLMNGVVRDYDPARAAKARKGGAVASEDVLTLRNERFVIPEILFHPSDIGMQQSGIADLVVQSLSVLPIGLWPGLLANIVVVGGNALFENFIQRLQSEIVQRVPDECVVRVARPEDPITSTWSGAAKFATHEHADMLSVTKQDYEEHGAAWVARKFAAGLGVD